MDEKIEKREREREREQRPSMWNEWVCVKYNIVFVCVLCNVCAFWLMQKFHWNATIYTLRAFFHCLVWVFLSERER